MTRQTPLPDAALDWLSRSRRDRDQGPTMAGQYQGLLIMAQILGGMSAHDVNRAIDAYEQRRTPTPSLALIAAHEHTAPGVRLDDTRHIRAVMLSSPTVRAWLADLPALRVLYVAKDDQRPIDPLPGAHTLTVPVSNEVLAEYDREAEAIAVGRDGYGNDGSAPPLTSRSVRR